MAAFNIVGATRIDIQVDYSGQPFTVAVGGIVHTFVRTHAVT